MADLKLLENALELLTNGMQKPDTPLGDMFGLLGVEPLAIPAAVETIRNARHWELKSKNVVGWGIGNILTKGKLHDELSLKIYVREKVPQSKLIAEQIVPKLLDLAGVGSVPMDIEEIGDIRLEYLKAHLRPVPGGYSIGHKMVEGGSIGCLVRKRGNPESLYILSCSHVLANSGTGEKGDAVLQPSHGDGGTDMNKNIIAKLVDWVPFDFSTEYTNQVDAAIAGPITNNECEAEIAEIGLIPHGVRRVTKRTKVQKVGRSTHHTWGMVKDAHFRTTIQYPKPGGGEGRVRFRDLVLCTRFTAKGDSGALVLDEDGYAVGLHMAGSSATSIFCPIHSVLDALGVELVNKDI